jgi:Zn-dependent protease with chaperone function
MQHLKARWICLATWICDGHEMVMQDDTKLTLYFDGVSTRAKVVTAQLKADDLVLAWEEGELRRTPIIDINFSINQAGKFAIGHFVDGASVQLSDEVLIAKLSSKVTLPMLMAQNWRGAALTLALLLALTFGLYRWGIPAVADTAANYIPESWAKNIQEAVVKDLDSNLCQASKLPDVRQIDLLQKFEALKLATNNAIQPASNAELIFRDCKFMGPNAFNLGREIIVLTDEMVLFTENDEALLGVLAHELGHLQSDHVMRSILRYAGVGALSTVLLGDVSAIAAVAPTVVLRNQYTQVFEREADALAITRLKAAGISTKPLAALFRKLGKHDGDNKWEWLFSHPDSGERAKLFDH